VYTSSITYTLDYYVSKLVSIEVSI